MKVGIIGAGTMGGGIAQVFAQNGHEVLLCDLNDELAQKGRARVVKSLDKLVAKGKMERAAADEIAARLTTGTRDLRRLRPDRRSGGRGHGHQAQNI